MVWEFPAVSQTRIDFWKKPQFTQSGMWWFTLLFGLFGLHHLLLRSPQTALILLLGNFILLGYPWLYDLVQLSSEERGGLSTDDLNKYGLSHPWGALGLAQGMWIPPKPSLSPSPLATPVASLSASASLATPVAPAPAPAPLATPVAPAPAALATPASATPASPSSASEPLATPAPPLSREARYKLIRGLKGPREKDRSEWGRVIRGGGLGDDPPNPYMFLMYALLIPLAPLAQMIAGDKYNAVSRFLDLTIIPFGFLFYLGAMIWDYMILFLYPSSLLRFGSKRFFPFTMVFGMDIDGHSPNLTGDVEIKGCKPDNVIISLLKTSAAILRVVGLSAPLDAAIATYEKAEQTVVQVEHAIEKDIPAAIQGATAVAKLTMTPSLQMPQMQMPLHSQMQKGGGRFGTLDYLTLGTLGAVIGGGFLLAVSRHGFSSANENTKANDTPPNARAI